MFCCNGDINTAKAHGRKKSTGTNDRTARAPAHRVFNWRNAPGMQAAARFENGEESLHGDPSAQKSKRSDSNDSYANNACIQRRFYKLKSEDDQVKKMAQPENRQSERGGQ